MDDIKTELDSNEFLPIFLKFYGPIWPGFAETIKSVKACPVKEMRF